MVPARVCEKPDFCILSAGARDAQPVVFRSEPDAHGPGAYHAVVLDGGGTPVLPAVLSSIVAVTLVVPDPDAVARAYVDTLEYRAVESGQVSESVASTWARAAARRPAVRAGAAEER